MAANNVSKKDLMRAYRDDPCKFITEILGVNLWKKQQDIAQSLCESRRVAVRSCHGSGKTFLAAQIALWWVFTRVRSTVITTAPTGRQVTELLWKEIRKSYSSAIVNLNKLGFSGLGGEILPKAPKLVIDDDWLCIGFSTDDPTSFQGWHSPGGILAIFDEAPGINHEIWEAAQGVLVGKDDRMICIGNPTEASGPFYKMFSAGKDTAKFHISAFDVPNVADGEVSIPGLCTLDWVEERKAEWGRDTPMWKSRVMGEFPDTSDAALVPLSWVEQANKKYEELESLQWVSPDIVAVDVARYGEDSTVIALACAKQGVKKLVKVSKTDTMETTGHVANIIRGQKSVLECRVDADGLGAGVYDRLKEQIGNVAIEMRGGMRPINNERYLNQRAEWYWTLRERLDPESDDPIALPPDSSLTNQLTSIRWKINSRGLIQIESKDDMRKRGLKSPDEADAVAMAIANMDDSSEFFFV